MNAHPLLRKLVSFALFWLTLCFSLAIFFNLLLTWTAGHATGMGLLSVLTLPLRMLVNLPDPVAAVPYADDLRAWAYFLAFIGALLFTWVVLARHDILNPVTMLKDPNSLPVERRLRTKLRDVGVWRAHDVTRGDSQAALVDKVKYFLSRLVPGMDASRIAYRGNGMLVPFNGPQPANRIYLGTVRQMLWIRKKKFNVYARPEHHVIVFGPSGAGKGASQMNPSLLMWNGQTDGSLDGSGMGWPGPVITSTVKNDHVDVSLEWRLSLSDQCFVYDPLQLFPEYKDFWVGWNPISQIRNFSDANRVAAALMESESQQGAGGGGGGNEEYFKAQALMVLAPLLLSAAIAQLPFRTVYEWSLSLDGEVANPDIIGPDGQVSPDSKMYQALDPLYEYQERTDDATPLNQLNQVFAKAEQEASGVWGSVRKVLQPYNDEKSVMSTDPANMPMMFDPSVFYNSPHATLYIIAPQVAGESKRMRPVFAAFITWLIEQAQEQAGKRGGKLAYPVLANLDEVKNVGAIPGLAHTLSLTRSIGFFVKHAWQDEAQIESAYGKDDAKTITSNSRSWVVLPGMSDSTHLEHLATLLGERRVRSRLRKGSNAPVENSQQVKAGSAAMIKELRDNQILILADNLPPMVIEANRYYADKVMSSRFHLGDHRRDTGQMPARDELRPSSPSRRSEQPPSLDRVRRPDRAIAAPADSSLHAGEPLLDESAPANPSEYFSGMREQLRARQDAAKAAPLQDPDLPQPRFNPEGRNTWS